MQKRFVSNLNIIQILAGGSEIDIAKTETTTVGPLGLTLFSTYSGGE